MSFTLHLARHQGMCFGVRDALRTTHQAASHSTVTVLGQLVHNPAVDAHLAQLGVRKALLEHPGSATTQQVVITAHGAAEAEKRPWRQAGHEIVDTTCPLVNKAHEALATLVREGYHPVVIGQRQHAEVRGLVGDHPQATVILTPDQADKVPRHARLGLVSQTTQPLDHALEVVQAVKNRHPESEVRFMDTVCRPTKQRQAALQELTEVCQLILVIGGRNSNNTRQLAAKARALGVPAIQIESAEELEAGWFRGLRHIGITAGTSTLDETVRQVMDRLQNLSAEPA